MYSRTDTIVSAKSNKPHPRPPSQMGLHEINKALGGLNRGFTVIGINLAPLSSLAYLFSLKHLKHMAKGDANNLSFVVCRQNSGYNWNALSCEVKKILKTDKLFPSKRF